MITRRRDYQKLTFILGADYTIRTVKSLKYLGLEIDEGRWLKVHEEKVRAKTLRIAQALPSILPNLGGPKTTKKKVFIKTCILVHRQILLNTPEYWCWSIPIKNVVVRHLKRAQRRLTLRTMRAYKTVSYEAATFIASISYIAVSKRTEFILQQKSWTKGEFRSQTHPSKGPADAMGYKPKKADWHIS